MNKDRRLQGSIQQTIELFKESFGLAGDQGKENKRKCESENCSNALYSLKESDLRGGAERLHYLSVATVKGQALIK